MKNSFYLFSPGRLSRKDNSLLFTFFNEDTEQEELRYIPIANTANFYCFGHLDINSELLTFLGKKGVNFHFFDFYEHYSGSFLSPKDIISGKTIIKQVEFYIDNTARVWLAKRFIMGAARNMYTNLKYYLRRGKDTTQGIKNIETLYPKLKDCSDIQEIFGIEGNIRISYYQCFNEILKDFKFEKRIKNPPTDSINSLISFLNMMCYTLCLDMCHQTPLNSTIGYLHQPSDRRHSLILDISEVFKPIISDRVLFTIINKKIVQENDFIEENNKIYISAKAKRKIIKLWDDKIKETFFHKELQKHISYRSLILNEFHKLQKHILKEIPYKPFVAWW